MDGPRRSLLLTRLDPARNVARFYSLSVEPTLFGDTALVREWGRLGTRGRLKINLFATAVEAESALTRISSAKERRGYRS